MSNNRPNSPTPEQKEEAADLLVAEHHLELDKKMQEAAQKDDKPALEAAKKEHDDYVEANKDSVERTEKKAVLSLLSLFGVRLGGSFGAAPSSFATFGLDSDSDSDLSSSPSPRR